MTEEEVEEIEEEVDETEEEVEEIETEDISEKDDDISSKEEEVDETEEEIDKMSGNDFAEYTQKFVDKGEMQPQIRDYLMRVRKGDKEKGDKIASTRVGFIERDRIHKQKEQFAQENSQSDAGHQKENEAEDILEKDDIPSSIDVGSIKDTKSTELDPLDLKDYLFPKERPWVWKSFAVMFVLFFGYYYIRYNNIIS
jgi:hypothetical protein